MKTIKTLMFLLVSVVGCALGITLTSDNLQTYCQVNTTHINCSHYDIADIDSDAFSLNTWGVTELIIDSTGISSFHPATFRPLGSLKKMRIRFHWNLRTLPGNLFDGLSNLEVLEITSNSIAALNSTTFQGLSGLKKLNLQFNSLEKTSVFLFSSNTNLEVLELGYNQLASLPDGVFDNLPNLKELSLNGNQLTTISSDLFRYNTNLNTLNARSNDIETIAPGSFRNQRNLKDLSLADNKLANVSFIDIYCLNLNYLDLCGNNDLQYLTNKTCYIKDAIKMAWQHYYGLYEKDCPFQASSTVNLKPHVAFIMILAILSFFRF